MVLIWPNLAITAFSSEANSTLWPSWNSKTTQSGKKVAVRSTCLLTTRVPAARSPSRCRCGVAQMAMAPPGPRWPGPRGPKGKWHQALDQSVGLALRPLPGPQRARERTTVSGLPVTSQANRRGQGLPHSCSMLIADSPLTQSLPDTPSVVSHHHGQEDLEFSLHVNGEVTTRIVGEARGGCVVRV